MWSTENSNAEAILAFYNLKKTRKWSFSFPFLDLCLFGCLEREEKHGKSNETERRPVLSPPLLRAQRRVWGGARWEQGALSPARVQSNRLAPGGAGSAWGHLNVTSGRAHALPPGAPPGGAGLTLRRARSQAGARGATARSEASLSRRQARTAGSPGSPRASRPRPAAGRCPPTPEHLGRSPAGTAWPTREPTGTPGGWGRGGGGGPFARGSGRGRGLRSGDAKRSAGAG